MSARKIAAIISAYYAEKFLKDRIENLLEQDGFVPQIVVVSVVGRRLPASDPAGARPAGRDEPARADALR